MQPEAISDQKRFVRGEHWLRARYHLRVRDHVHHGAWELLIIAGPSPAEEINCIRACMHKARITAVDINEQNVMKAIDAGADDAFVCDISNFENLHAGNGHYRKTVPPVELRDKKFDVICLDLTGPANDWLQAVVGCYYRSVASGGVMMVTFSYGRDVVEAQQGEWEHFRYKAHEKWHHNDEQYKNQSARNSWIGLKDVPDIVAIRVWYALQTRCADLKSCVQYRGSQMPMVSCLIAKGCYGIAKFRALSPDDLCHAVFDEQLNLSMLYACPAERIDAFRLAVTRKEAARKAVETKQRKKRIAQIRPVPLLTFQENKDDGPEQQN